MDRDLPLLSTRAVAAAAGALVAITDAHALKPTERERLESAYHAIGDHMSDHPDLGHVTIEVHPQGSLLTGTTTRPEGKNEFDVDLVLSMVRGLHEQIDPPPLLSMAFDALSEHAKRHELEIERKRRCVQLRYANQMHADVTPVIHHPQLFGLHGDTFGLVPDRELLRYMDTNPKGFGRWFDTSAARMPMFTLRKDLAVYAKADIVPLPSVAIFDRLLARIVQLLKIHRNMFFVVQDPCLCPPSVVITTLAVHAYNAAVTHTFSSPLDLMLEIWREMPRYIRCERDHRGRQIWFVDNPAAPRDNLADRMNQCQDRQDAFFAWHDRFGEDLLALIAQADSSSGLDVLSKSVTKTYGAIAGRGINAAMISAVNGQRSSRTVSVPVRSTASAIAAAPSIVMASQSHGFFGSD